jgi:hypothetical protein
VLPADDDSDALRADDASNMLSGGGGDDTTTLVIGAIDADSNLDAGDVLDLDAIGGGAIGAICGDLVEIEDGDSVAIGGSNLDANALHIGNDDGTDVLLGNC